MVPDYPKEQYVRSANVGLPGDEYTLRKERHNSRLLYIHLEDLYVRHSLEMQGPVRRGPLDAWGPNPDLPHRKPIDASNQSKQAATNYSDRALQDSKIANATRRALGCSWHPSGHLDDGLKNYAVSRVSSDWHETPPQEDPIPDDYVQDFHRTLYEYDEDNPHASREPMQHETPIPDKYLQEFNRMWYEDDEDNDADQLLADLTPNSHAPWRVHQPLRPMYGPDGDFRTSTRYWDSKEITEWCKASYEATVSHHEVVEPKPMSTPKSQSFFVEPNPVIVREPQSFFDFSNSSLPYIKQKKKHSRASSRWKQLGKRFRQNRRT